MAQLSKKFADVDPVWHKIREEAEEVVAREPLLGSIVHSGILLHPTLEHAIANRLAIKLASRELAESVLRDLTETAMEADPGIAAATRADIVAVVDRDPACHRFLQPVLFFKGFQAIQAYRLAHWLWSNDRKDLAYLIQMRTSEAFGVDIHPGATIGQGIMIDHAHSIVIGETAIVGNDVSMLHSVTLGGTGKDDGARHPTIGNGVMIGAGAKILGNFTVGDCSRIAAGSVVLQEVPPMKTVAGVPARIVGEAGCSEPAKTMDQLLRDVSVPG